MKLFVQIRQNMQKKTENDGIKKDLFTLVSLFHVKEFSNETIKVENV